VNKLSLLYKAILQKIKIWNYDKFTLTPAEFGIKNGPFQCSDYAVKGE